MAYLFSTIGMSVINALGLLIYPFYGVLILNALIILTAFLLEQFLRVSIFKKHTIVYDNLDLLKPIKQQELLQDLSDRTGHDIRKARIRNIDFKKDHATLEIYFRDQESRNKKKNQLPPEDN